MSTGSSGGAAEVGRNRELSRPSIAAGLRCSLLLVLVGALVSCRGEKQPRGDRIEPDGACLALLRKAGVAFRSVPAVKGVRTPVVIQAPIAGVRLLPRGRREALMDCALARGLLEAGPVLRGLEIEALEFSAAYDYRERRDSRTLSAHARGLAIDVHVVHSRSRPYPIATAFEKGAGQWRRIRPGPGAVQACVGEPRTGAGKLLRTLACRLKLHTSFQILVTPDDNADHRDHLHLEVYPDVADSPPTSEGPA
jgi:hypothetical protein